MSLNFVHREPPTLTKKIYKLERDWTPQSTTPVSFFFFFFPLLPSFFFSFLLLLLLLLLLTFYYISYINYLLVVFFNFINSYNKVIPFKVCFFPPTPSPSLRFFILIKIKQCIELIL